MPNEISQEQPQAIDWSATKRAIYEIRHHYRYTYNGPVTDLRQQLVMVPPDQHADQRLLNHIIEVRGATGHSLATEWDNFDNRVVQVRAERVEHAIDFETTYRVERRAGSGSSWRPSARTIRALLQPTALTAPDDRLEAAATEIAARTNAPHERAELAHDWAARALVYKPGVTGVQTPAAMALHLGRGVCQDYAHILLCVLRLLEVPARYVSGHLLGEGAPHAWVEAIILGEPSDETEVLVYDPTHHRRAGLNYITVAVGRDFADVSPTSGFFSGPYSGRLSSSKQARIVEVEHIGSSALAQRGRRAS